MSENLSTIAPIDTAMLRRDKRRLYPIPPGQCESVFAMLDTLCDEIDRLRPVVRAARAHMDAVTIGQRGYVPTADALRDALEAQ